MKWREIDAMMTLTSAVAIDITAASAAVDYSSVITAFSPSPLPVSSRTSPLAPQTLVRSTKAPITKWPERPQSECTRPVPLVVGFEHAANPLCARRRRPPSSETLERRLRLQLLLVNNCASIFHSVSHPSMRPTDCVASPCHASTAQ